MAGALAAIDDARVEAQLRLPRPTIVITASVNLLTSALEESIGLAQTRKDLGVVALVAACPHTRMAQ
jgi:hypothetical protein